MLIEVTYLYAIIDLLAIATYSEISKALFQTQGVLVEFKELLVESKELFHEIDIKSLHTYSQPERRLYRQNS